MVGKDKARVYITLPKKQLKILRKIAWSYDETLSEFFEWVVFKFLKERNKETDL